MKNINEEVVGSLEEKEASELLEVEPTANDLLLLDEVVKDDLDDEEINYNYNEELIDKNRQTRYVNDNVRFYLDTVGNHRILTSEEVTNLAKRIRNGDKDAANELFNNNLKLVVKRAQVYYGYTMTTSLTLMDLIQDGNLGLLKAIERFDYRKGYKFSTYATWWIDQSITRSIMDNGKMIRIPVHANEKANKIKFFEHQYIENFHIKPTDTELYEYAIENGLDISWKHFQLLICSSSPISLDYKVNDDSDSTLGDFVTNLKTNHEPDVLKNISMNKAIIALLNIIRVKFNSTADIDRNIEIFMYRNGLINGEIKTLEEVGQMYGLTRERVRQINEKIIRKLQRIIQGEARLLNIEEINSLESVIDVLCQYAIDHGINESGTTKGKVKTKQK